MKRLAVVGLAFTLFAIVLGIHELVLPTQGELDPSLDYRQAYDYLKERSPALIAAATDEDSTLVFGSSEFYPNTFLAQHPANLPENYGVDLNWVTVGSGGTQSLQHTLLLGALAPELKTDKVALILSPQWFTDNGITPEEYRSKSSWEIYRAFMDNPRLSPQTRKAVAKRVARLSQKPERARGIEENSLFVRIEEPIRGYIEDNKLRWERQLKTLKGTYPPKAENTAGTGRKKPDWDALLADATTDAAAATTDNDFGMLTEYYRRHLADTLDTFAGAETRDRFVPSREFDDLRLFLTVCREVGVTPLVVTMPVNGPWYDYTQHPQADRKAFYREVRKLCAEMGAYCADFSDREYDKGFFFDTLHLGWRGWVQVAQAIDGYGEGSAARTAADSADAAAPAEEGQGRL
jgi:D-alanine transfer protein